MSALSDLTDEVLNRLTSFGIKQGRTAFLRAAVDSSELTWLVDATSNLGEGVAEIDSEQVYFKLYDSASESAVVAPDGRGWDGTTAASHLINSRITIEPTFPRRGVERAINSTIRRAFPAVWGVATTNLTINGVQATYALPATAQGVLAVRAEELGASGVWYPVRNYSFDGHADTTAYPTGKTVTIPSAVYPGRAVQVVYRSAPIALTDAHDEFSDCGLAESAKYAILLGTCADLMRFSDPQRLASHSASADEFDSKRGYGTPTKIANDLEAQFQKELASEASRLRQLYPASIHRKRF